MGPQQRGPSDAAIEGSLLLASMALAVLVYLALALGVAIFYHPAPPDLELFRPAARSVIRPEPQERLLYLTGLACILVLPGSFYWGLLRLRRRSPGCLDWMADRRVLAVRDTLLAVGVLDWLVVLATYSEIPTARLNLAVGAALICFLPRQLRLSLPRSRWLVHLLAGVLIVLLTQPLILDEQHLLSNAAVGDHFDLLLGAVNHVQHGKTILVDTISQYGILYPYVAVAALAPFGVSVAGVSLFFAAVSAISLVFVYLAICEKTGYRSFASLAVFVPVLGLLHPFFFVGSAFYFQFPIIYYQYHPLRVLCGAFFLWFVPVYLRRGGVRLMVAGYLGAGLSVLWNSDTGVVVLAAWTAALMFHAVARWPDGVRRALLRAGGHALLGTLALVGSLGLYLLFAWARSGRFPDPWSSFLYQRIFYGSGFMMVPMQFWEFWQPLVLVYLATLAACVGRAIRGLADSGTTWRAFIALYGLGIFSYYQARSHAGTLTAVAYPAVILACFFVADAIGELRGLRLRRMLEAPERRQTLLAAAMCGLVASFGLVNFVMAGFWYLGAKRAESPASVAEAGAVVEKLKPYLGNSETVIFSMASNYYHVRTGSWSGLPVTSPQEVALAAQARAVQQVLDRGSVRYVAVDTSIPGLWDGFHLDKFRPPDIALLGYDRLAGLYSQAET